MKTKKTLVIVMGVVILAVFIGTFAYLIQKARKPPAIQATVSPAMGDIMKVTVASGRISPRKRTNVKSRVSGVVETLFVEPGDRVAVGTPIARIDMVPNRVSLNDARNRLEKARLAYADVEEERGHQESLLKQGLISEYEYKQYQLKLETSALDLETAKGNLRFLEEGAEAEGTGSESTTIRSAVAGTILETPVQEGDAVAEAGAGGAGTVVAVISNMDELVFEGDIDESEVGKLRLGLELDVTIGAIEDKTFKATLDYISPKGVQQNQGAVQFAFKAALAPQKESVIRAGYSANAKIILDKRVNVLTLAENAILFDKDQRPYVEIETKPQRFERRDVTLGLSDGIKSEVLSGIALGDRVKSVKYGS
jgi:HlyD family secretion protein